MTSDAPTPDRAPTSDSAARWGSADVGALVTLPIRLVTGWAYFSAFWRRAVLEDKLDPAASGYVGEKLNHFLPNALGVKPVLEHLVTHPDQLHSAMVVFTLAEAVVGFLLLIGLLTRAMGACAFGLAFGILLGSGWLGTTCLDEWQIGGLGMASGFALFLSGGGVYSVDHMLAAKRFPLTQGAWFRRLASGAWAIPRQVPLVGSLAIILVDLATNQYFHGGVYGPLHNKSVKPLVEVSDARISNGVLRFSAYRVEGVDVYGSFVVDIAVVDTQTGEAMLDLQGSRLSGFPKTDIANRYVAHVRPGKRSLVIPLGAKAELTVDARPVRFDPAKAYTLVLADVSGSEWTAPVAVLGR